MGRIRRRVRGRWKQLAIVSALAVIAFVVAGVALTRPAPVVPVSGAIASYTPPPVKVKHAKVAVFLGDSLTTGAGVKDTKKRWTSLVANHYGWGEVNMGAGGTGFVRTGNMNSCGKEFCANFPGRVQEIVAVAPDIVVVTGGRNDVRASAAEIAATAKEFYSSLRAALPEVSIVAVSCFWDDDEAPAAVSALNAVVRAEVGAVGGTFIDVGQPFAGKPELIGPDGVHPTEGGYADLAKIVRPAIDASGIPTHAE